MLRLRKNLSGVNQRTMERVRMDKWLWAARFFKTRSLAAKACDLNRVTSNGIAAKPARDVREKDVLVIRNDAGEFEVAVLALSEMRGPATAAQMLYQETDASREQRMKLMEEKKTMPAFDLFAEGRPSKRDRREIDRFRERDR